MTGRSLPRLLLHSSLPRRRPFGTISESTRPEVELFINDQSVKVPNDVTIIQACESIGVTIPRFCYHPRLHIAGNCRMCLVQVEKVPKPVASCAMPVAPGMRILTETAMVKKAREGVMEFLLANHPLDCVVCDQGGECDLQDQAMAYGSDRSRFPMREYGKRAVEDKDLGPLVKTSMNRCIHCTRCVRFANDIAGVPDLGTTGRGNDMQIGMYIEAMLGGELSGNVIDLCPVGALTSRPYAFRARPWELKGTVSVDVMDAVGSNIRVDSKGCEVMRILPRLHEDVNEEWLSDKGRFVCDALTRQRLLQPQIRKNGTLTSVTWNTALSTITSRLVGTPGEDIQVLVGAFTDVETVKAAHDLFTQLGVTALDFDGPRKGIDVASLPRSLTRIPPLAELEQAETIVLVGTNPRHEAPLVNARIRKAYLQGDARIQYIGPTGVNLTYEYEHLGDDSSAIARIDTSKSRTVVIVGQHLIMDRADYASTLHALGALLDRSAHLRIGVLPRWASRTGALQLGWGARPNPSAKVTIALTADDLHNVPADSFLIYLGHHGDIAAPRADILLPTPAYTEKDALWVNCEGRWQRGRTCVAPPGNGRSDWSVMRALSEYLEAATLCNAREGLPLRSAAKGVLVQRLPYDTLDELRQTLDFTLDVVPEWKHEGRDLAKQLLSFKPNDKQSPLLPYTLPITDYYLTDSISRNSETMAKCSLAFTKHAYKHTFEIDAAVHHFHQESQGG